MTVLDAFLDESTNPVNGHVQVLMVKSGDMLAAIDLRHIVRTFSLVALQALPDAAPYVAGIMDFRGTSLPVIDLAIRLGQPSSAYTIHTPVILCTDNETQIGLIVPDILGIQIISKEDQQPTFELAPLNNAIRASVHTGQGMAFLLNTSWLVHTELYQATAKKTKSVMP